MNEINKHYVIGGVCLVFVIVVVGMLIGNTYSIGDNISIEEINSIINNKENSVIYILNSKSNNMNNTNILNYLNDNGINFSVYDVSKVDRDEYNTFLSIFDIDNKLFNVPAIIYIREGIMFANIINIDDVRIVETFVNDYDLIVNS